MVLGPSEIWVAVLVLAIVGVVMLSRRLQRGMGRMDQAIAQIVDRRLVTAKDGVLDPRLLRDLALGAPLDTMLGEPWNVLRLSGPQAATAVEVLRELWDVDGPADWHEVVEHRLADRYAEPEVELVLADRPVFGTPGSGLGDEQVAAWAESIAERATAAGAADGRIAELVATVDRVATAEAFVAAAGQLPIPVRSVRAYDASRAVNLARWGLAAGFCDEEQAREVIARAGRLADRHYRSWDQFAAGYVLGRVLALDGVDDAFATSAATVAKDLLVGPDGPWRVVPWGRPARVGSSGRPLA